MDDIEHFARVMGMKPHREVLEVREVEGGHAVRTHDGQWTLIRDDGTRADRVAGPVGLVDPDEAEAAMLRGFHGEPDPEDEPAKPAPKRRGRA